MSKFKSYKDLIIWQKGIELVKMVYQLSNNFPQSEVFGLTSQMRRCAVSIPSNIAEGWGRDSKKSFKQFLNIARGSLLELETQIIIAEMLGYLNKNENLIISELVVEESKMLNSFINKLKENN